MEESKSTNANIQLDSVAPVSGPVDPHSQPEERKIHKSECNISRVPSRAMEESKSTNANIQLDSVAPVSGPVDPHSQPEEEYEKSFMNSTQSSVGDLVESLEDISLEGKNEVLMLDDNAMPKSNISDSRKKSLDIKSDMDSDDKKWRSKTHAEEVTRLQNLKHAATEIFTVQRTFVYYLKDMVEVYPNYLSEYGKEMNKDILNTNKMHIVMRIQHELTQLLPLHEEMLKDFKQTIDNWNSLEPCMADVLLKYAPMLKFCTQFMKLKSSFVTELIALRTKDEDFHIATSKFEEEIFKRGLVEQQLDQVHQNFMRYKILMTSYQKYLIEGSEEFVKADNAIQQIETITQAVNNEMGLPTTKELNDLFHKFKKAVDVCSLIMESVVQKRTRKGWQTRNIYLFNEVLWICRESFKIVASGDFDMSRSYQIQLEFLTTKTNCHLDYDRELTIKSRTKSFIIRFSDARERDKWNVEIRKARQNKRDYKARMHKSLDKIIDQQRSDAIINRKPKNMEAYEEKAISKNSETRSQPKHYRGSIHQALLLSYQDSSTCLMNGCRRTFTAFNWRHHCRSCGWLICKKCVGKAPISKAGIISKEIVCPQCFDTVIKHYKNGTLFPENLVHKEADGVYRLVHRPKTNETKYIDPKTLFEWPNNKHLKKLNIKSRTLNESGMIFGKVFSRKRYYKEKMRYAQLDESAQLRFFKAAMDILPTCEYVIHGFLLDEKIQTDDSVIFELRKKITPKKEEIIRFRVEEKSVMKWSNALHKALSLVDV